VPLQNADVTNASPATTNITSSLFNRYTDYPLKEEQMLECFLPLKDLLVAYSFKKYSNEAMCLSEKDERQLRKLRFVYMIKCLCQNGSVMMNNPIQKTSILSSQQSFEHLKTFIKDEIGNAKDVDPRLYNPNKTTKPVRGARNVALRQFLEPALAAAIAASSTTSSEAVPVTNTVAKNGTATVNNESTTSSSPLTQNNIPQLMQINTGLVQHGVSAFHQLKPGRWLHVSGGNDDALRVKCDSVQSWPLPPQSSSGYSGNSNFELMYGTNVDKEQQHKKTLQEALRSNISPPMIRQQMDNRPQDSSMGINQNRTFFYNEEMHTNILQSYGDNSNMTMHHNSDADIQTNLFPQQNQSYLDNAIPSYSILGWPSHPQTNEIKESKEAVFLHSNDLMCDALDYRPSINSVWSSGVNAPLQTQSSIPMTCANTANANNNSTNSFPSPFIQSSYPYSQNTSSQSSSRHSSFTNHFSPSHLNQMLAPGLMFSHLPTSTTNSTSLYTSNSNDAFNNLSVSPPPGITTNRLKESTPISREHMHLKTVQQQQQQQQQQQHVFPSILWPMQQHQTLNISMQNGQEQPD
ncbi:unnamed protein product, partial [Didymodactylos carnosus]